MRFRAIIPLVVMGGFLFSGNVFAELCNGKVPTIVGTDSDDTLLGTSGVDVIVGLGGNDTITGFGGDDTICGGAGYDTIDGGAGNDFIKGGPDDDLIFGNDGADVIRGSRGNDTIDGGAGDDSIYGGVGDDIIKGGPDDDIIDGSDGDDQLRGSRGDDILDGGLGNDSLHGGVQDFRDTCDYEDDDLYRPISCERDNVDPVPPLQCELDVNPTSQTFLAKSDIIELMDGNIIDAPISTFRVGEKNVWILPTANQHIVDGVSTRLSVSHTLTVGGLSNPKEINMGMFPEESFTPVSPTATTGTSGYKWITNTYQTADGVLGFVHAEYTGENDYWTMPCDPWIDRAYCAPGKSKIGLAWMDTTPGFHHNPVFVYLGHIAGFTADRQHFNVHGTPYFINTVDGVRYMNIVFHDSHRVDWGQITIARSPLQEVITAAKEGRTSEWKKYNNGQWEDAITGTSSSILPKVPELQSIDPNIANGRVIVHSDAVYHEDSKRYFLSAYTLERSGHNSDTGTPSRLVFYDSCDGINWNFNRYANDRTDGEWGYSYVSIFDDDGRDNGRATGPFVLMSGFDYGRPKKHVLTVDISVPDACNCP